MTDDGDGVVTRDGKRAGWAGPIGEGLAQQSRRKELISSGDRKDVKQTITLRKGCLSKSDAQSQGQGEGTQIGLCHRKGDSL